MSSFRGTKPRKADVITYAFSEDRRDEKTEDAADRPRVAARAVSPGLVAANILSAIVAVEDPIVTVLARERLRRWDRFRISLDLIVAVSEPMDVLGLEVVHFLGPASRLS